MEDPRFDNTMAWSQPDRCRRCRYPMASSAEVCPACSKPVRLFSAISGRLLFQRLGRTAASVWGVLQLLLLLLVGLTVAYYLSPLLLFFPLVALSAEPPASRGGKTVVVARRQARS